MGKKLIDSVNKFLGVDNGGNVLCGPYLPFGLARPGPDNAVIRTNGYITDEKLTRFSANHVSGTGGKGRYGNIGILPFSGKKNPANIQYDIRDEVASVGMYKCNLVPDNIQVELTCTHKTGFHRYTFEKTKLQKIFIDIGCSIGGESIGGFIEYINNDEIQGRADLQGGWGHDFPYSVYFYIKLNSPFSMCKLQNSEGSVSESSADGINCSAILSFDECNMLELQVGISYVSIAKARESVEEEIGEKSFEVIKKNAEDIWEKNLSAISVEGGTQEHEIIFYSLFTRLLCMPADLGIDDENPFWVSGKRNFTDIYCLWDSVRNANSFFTLFAPEFAADLLNCLIDIANHTGWFPDFWLAGHSGHVQGGSSADILFCEAAAKKLKGIDYHQALKYMKKNLEVMPPNPFLCGRYLDEYLEKGYLSTNIKNCVSRSIEYSYQDWCIANLAERLGEYDLAEKSLNSSLNIWKLWKNDMKCFAPKTPDGNWAEPFNPSKPTRPDYWEDPYYYEGVGHEWSLCLLHDIEGLIKKHGGKKSFVEHLDAFFENYLYNWKEIILHTPYLYHYVGRPDKTVETVRKLIAEKYRNIRSGLPDNEDMGAQSSFYMCSAIGLYPVMGQDLYLLSTPLFKKIEIKIGNSGNSLLIKSPNLTDTSTYINKVYLNGNELNRNWLRHTEISQGGKIEIVLGEKPNAWGTDDLPVSSVDNFK